MHVVRKPKLTEVVAMKRLLDVAANEGSVLSRDLPELYENVRDFYVYVDEDGLGGLVALHIDMVDLAEVRSLVVREDLRGRGIGKQLLEAVISESRQLDIVRLYSLTRSPEFFLKQDFHEIEKEELPHKVFKDCLRCRLFPGCDEIAVVKDLSVYHYEGE